MDLRLKLACEFAAAVLQDLAQLNASAFHPAARNALIEREAAIILDLFRYYSIPLDDYASSDPALIQQFLDRYSALRSAIDFATALANRLFHDPQIDFEICNDPEGCHTCCEGQSISMDIHFRSDFPPGSDPRLMEFDTELYGAGSPYMELGDLQGLLIVHPCNWLCHEEVCLDHEEAVGK